MIGVGRAGGPRRGLVPVVGCGRAALPSRGAVAARGPAPVPAARRQLLRLDLHRDGPPAVDRLRADGDGRRGLARRTSASWWWIYARRLHAALRGPRRSSRWACCSARSGPGLPDADPTAGVHHEGEPDARARVLGGTVMELTTIWFVLIAVLWIGYFVLEGFDFGVGILLPVIGRNEPERRAMIRTIGPVWDGNEVWLLVAGGATFAAFPEWYATLFSGFYLALFADPRRPHRARGRDRVPQQARRPGLADALGLGDRRRLASCPPCCGASPSPTSCRACRSTPTRSSPATFFTLLNPFALAGRPDDAPAVRHPRRTSSWPSRPRASVRDRAEPARRLRSAWPRRVVAVAFLGWTLALRGNPAAVAAPVVAALALVGGIARQPRPARGLGVPRHGASRSRSRWSRCSSRSSRT